MSSSISDAHLRNSAISHVSGGLPDVVDDSVWTVCFLMIFLASAGIHAILLRLNLQRGRLFPFVGLGMMFSLIRTVTMCLRLAWMYHLTNRGLAVGAAIFVAAGALILYIINLFFAQRILRLFQPSLGWSKPAKAFFLFWLALFPPMLIMLISVLTQSLYTTNPATTRIDKKVQQVGVVYLMCVAFVPLPVVLLALCLPIRQARDNFGRGHPLSKAFLVLFTSTLLTTNATFRTASAFLPGMSKSGPLWYREKWAFYVFNFGLEAIVVYTNLIFRIDQRFYVPAGCKGPGDYTARKSMDFKRQSAYIEKRQSKHLDKGKGKEFPSVTVNELQPDAELGETLTSQESVLLYRAHSYGVSDLCQCPDTKQESEKQPQMLGAQGP